MKIKLIALVTAFFLVLGLNTSCYSFDTCSNLDEKVTVGPLEYDRYWVPRSGQACITLKPLQEGHQYDITCSVSRPFDPFLTDAKLSYGTASPSYENSAIILHNVHVNHKASLFYYDSIEINNNDETDGFSVNCHATDLGKSV
jgi:hypothetical protein